MPALTQLNSKTLRRSRGPAILRMRLCMILLSPLLLFTICVAPQQTNAAFDGGVGIFLTVTPLSKNVLNYYAIPKAKLAKSYGLQFVNLIVHWKDLEPRDNNYKFQALADFIKAIKAQGVQCVVRIYFNGGSWIQAAPNWLFQSKRAAYYREGNYRQPVPWDQTYLDQMTQFMLQLGLWLKKQSPSSIPDALQISAGGVYGEEVVLGVDWVTGFKGDYDAYFLRLMAAEKKHVSVFNKVAGYFKNLDTVLMINHLYDDDPEMDDILMQYAIDLDVKWFQTNSWSGYLLDTWCGSLIMDMFARHSANTHFFLEDEFGSKASVPIVHRLSNIAQLESLYGIKFKAVSISVDDLTSNNATAISDLVTYVLSHP
jgi:hypothetical protein